MQYYKKVGTKVLSAKFYVDVAKILFRRKFVPYSIQVYTLHLTFCSSVSLVTSRSAKDTFLAYDNRH